MPFPPFARESLNAYQDRIGNLTCTCDETAEMTSHCVLVIEIMHKGDKLHILHRKVGAGGMKVERLFGHPKTIEHALGFIESTNV
jgi:hypothetical protein